MKDFLKFIVKPLAAVAILSCTFIYLANISYKAQEAELYQLRTKQYAVWEKMTGNPNKLTLEEFIIWKGTE
jgi:hypothetical protein